MSSSSSRKGIGRQVERSSVEYQCDIKIQKRRYDKGSRESSNQVALKKSQGQPLTSRQECAFCKMKKWDHRGIFIPYTLFSSVQKLKAPELELPAILREWYCIQCQANHFVYNDIYVLCGYFLWVYFTEVHQITLQDDQSCGLRTEQTYINSTECLEKNLDKHLLIGISVQPL